MKRYFWVVFIIGGLGIAMEELQIESSQVAVNYGNFQNSLYYPCGIPLQELDDQALVQARSWLERFLNGQPNEHQSIAIFEETAQVTTYSEKLAVVTAIIPTMIEGELAHTHFYGMGEQLKSGSLMFTVIVSLEEAGEKVRIQGSVTAVGSGT